MEDIAFLFEFMNSPESVARSSQRTASCEGKKRSCPQFCLPSTPLMETDDIWVLRKAKVQFDSLNNLDGMIIIIIMCKTIIILNIFEWRLQNNSTVSVEN